jgi:hypothetical protein
VRSIGFNGIKAPIMAVQLNTGTDYGMSHLQDLECALGAKSLSTYEGKLMDAPSTEQDLRLLVGRSDSVTSKPYYIRIRGGGGTRAEREARIAEIEKEIKTLADSARYAIQASGRVESLKRRAGMLKGDMHCIKVGGDSYKEKRNRSLIYEDAIMAVKNCIKHGITLSGNVSLYHSIMNNRSVITDHIVTAFCNKNETINVMIGKTPEKLRDVIREILVLIANGSLAAYEAVLDNATGDKKIKKTILDTIKGSTECVNYNLLTEEYERFHTAGDIFSDQEVFTHETYSQIRDLSEMWELFDTTDLDNEHGSEHLISFIPRLISPGNIDKETLRTIFSILGLFVTSNQLITVIPAEKRNNKL